jgi:DNA-binding transcriptional regulator YdaS (Cro superfamily)
MGRHSPIQDAIDIAGSEAKLGEGTGFSQVAINKAKHRGSVSAEMALAIHRFTVGQVSASSLRPDLWASPGDVPVAPSTSPQDGEGDHASERESTA